MISEEENPLELQTFVSTSLYGNPYKLANEIGILHSKELTKRTLRNVGFELSYFKEEKFFSPEIFEGPFTVEFDSLHEQPLSVKFETVILKDTLLYISAKGENVIVHNFSKNLNTQYLDYFEYSDTVTFSELVGNQYCRFRLMPNFNQLSDAIKGKNIHFSSTANHNLFIF
ncbi:MAG: hypothetical protein HC906_11690 [Bacteroidales bacterium]|nr:hypothetical protein [Bacteroidales bacterium]